MKFLSEMHVKRLSLENYFLFPYEQTKIFFPTFSSWKTTELFPYYPSLENDQTFSETFPDSAGSPYLWKKGCLKTSSLNLCSVSDAQQPEIGLYMTNEIIVVKQQVSHELPENYKMLLKAPLISRRHPLPQFGGVRLTTGESVLQQYLILARL